MACRASAFGVSGAVSVVCDCALLSVFLVASDLPSLVFFNPRTFWSCWLALGLFGCSPLNGQRHPSFNVVLSEQQTKGSLTVMEHVEEVAYTGVGRCLLNPRQVLTAKTVHGAGKGRIREGKGRETGQKYASLEECKGFWGSRPDGLIYTIQECDACKVEDSILHLTCLLMIANVNVVMVLLVLQVPRPRPTPPVCLAWAVLGNHGLIPDSLKTAGTVFAASALIGRSPEFMVVMIPLVVLVLWLCDSTESSAARCQRLER